MCFCLHPSNCECVRRSQLGVTGPSIHHLKWHKLRLNWLQTLTSRHTVWFQPSKPLCSPSMSSTHTEIKCFDASPSLHVFSVIALSLSLSPPWAILTLCLSVSLSLLLQPCCIYVSLPLSPRSVLPLSGGKRSSLALWAPPTGEKRHVTARELALSQRAGFSRHWGAGRAGGSATKWSLYSKVYRYLGCYYNSGCLVNTTQHVVEGCYPKQLTVLWYKTQNIWIMFFFFFFFFFFFCALKFFILCVWFCSFFLFWKWAEFF